ncbi:MAG: oxidoreductase [Gammaproteobacteria bacterium]|nr:oxidoreductase [Gammaproteobacteria bacterium]
MSAIVNHIERGTYLDSLALMRLSVQLQEEAGVEEAALMMATPANLELLQAAGLIDPERANTHPTDDGSHNGLAGLGAHDLVIAIRAVDAHSASAAMRAAHHHLSAMRSGAAASMDAGPANARSLGAALERLPTANLALISVPGAFAAGEAQAALDAGLDVMVFSDNVPVAEERRLKERAQAAGRLLMGPDCGTALVAGTAIGFANAIPSGDIGIIAASGTGLQEFSVLLAEDGVGVSHALGVGGRDLSEAVGALGCLSALARLAADPGTRHIVVIAKPPAPTVAERVVHALSQCGKPASACLIGYHRGGATQTVKSIRIYSRIIDIAEAILGHGIGRHGSGHSYRAAGIASLPRDPSDRDPSDRGQGNRGQAAGSGRIQGLYAGGTLCAEAQQVLVQAGEAVESNTPLAGVSRLSATPGARVHRLFDLGADEFTRGRPHPMLEPAVRTAPLRAALADPQVAVILVDLVLGYGAHPDPAKILVDALGRGRTKPVIASLCGTRGDPQNLEAQRSALRAAGAAVHTSAARACEHALALVRQRP